jgi:carbon storage regulator
MLVLRRKRGQQVCIPQLDCVLTILDITAGQVRIGLTAPKEVKAYRGEVWERIENDLTAVEVERLLQRPARDSPATPWDNS